ncbi:unnamed protein product [Durusdinium trenchii]|uniref:Radial spoke head protein 4-like A n=2 Tax=Durusdinium trenchii TaxID=1381693 RepID=A0ABP0NGT1_9DINO
MACKSEGPRCAVLDVRLEGAQKLVGSWLKAVRQAVECEPLNMSIISVHNDYYVSRLTLASSQAQVTKALDDLEQECVLRPMGLAWPGLAPEHVAGVPQGLPVPSFGKKRKASERGRLFAIGEDAALAALRSAGQALAAEVDDVVGLLQYWTTDAGRFFPVAEKVVKSLPSKVTLEVVVATEDENEAKVKLLQQELSSKVVLERLSLEDAAVVGKVLEPLCSSWPLQLQLPKGASLALRARPAVLLQRRRAPQGTPCIQILSEVPPGRLSGELLFGAPLLLEAEHQDADQMKALVADLGSNFLVASGQLQPVCLQATRCRHFYAIYACEGQLFLHGLAAETWQSSAL